MSETKPKRCKYCGEPVYGKTFGYPPICDSAECDEEDRQNEIAMRDQARWDAEDDDYNRYM